LKGTSKSLLFFWEREVPLGRAEGLHSWALDKPKRKGVGGRGLLSLVGHAHQNANPFFFSLSESLLQGRPPFGKGERVGGGGKGKVKIFFLKSKK
jgi:hypothetical protein